MKFKVGDRVVRIESEQYESIAPKGSPRWYGIITSPHSKDSWNVLTYDNKPMWWATKNIRLLTPLDKVLK